MFTFDYNGNIVTQQRYEGSTLVDSLTYQYATNSAGHLLSNRLYSVDDSVTVASLSATDMEDMPAYNNATPNTSNNYKYTQIGELKSDAQEEISEIHWRVDSKISEITRTSGSVKKNLKFEYDAMGNRVAKHVYAGSVLESSTYYVRDAQGNVMGVYEHKMDAANAVMEYKLIERNIYGSAQVGICKDTVDLNITNSSGALTQATYYHARQLNHRQYSLSNHLGNVLTTIGDGKAAADSNNDGVIDYFTAYIISVSDYSPFGVELASRSWSIEEYRNGFNGKEKVTEITGNSSDYDFGARICDARIGRWFGADPLQDKFSSWSPYVFCLDNPVALIDPDGMAPGDPRYLFYQNVGTSCIKIVALKNSEVNKFKGLYLIAQIRTENGFTDAPGNNPFNIKMAGDLGTFSNPKTPKAGKVWGNFSTMDNGVLAAVDLMERKYSKAFEALTSDDKTIVDFASGLNTNNDGKAWGTNTKLMKEIFKGVVADYEKSLNSQINEVSQQIITLDEKMKSASLSEFPAMLTENFSFKNKKELLNKDLLLLQQFKKNENIK